MDEIDLFATLRPQPADDLTSHRERARMRLEAAMAGPGARARARRFEGLALPGRKVVAVSGAALAMGGAVVLPTVLSSGSGGVGSLVTSAWAVQPRKDGTVKVTIKDASDPAGLERALRSAGVRAVVASPRETSVKNPRGGWMAFPSCRYRTTGPLFEPAAVQANVVSVPWSATGPSEVIAIIHPDAMPPGSVLFIVDTFSVKENGSRVLSVTAPAVLKSGKLPRCVPHPMPVPIPSATPEPSLPSGSPQPTTPGTPPATPVPSATPSRTYSPTPVPSGSPTPVPSGSPTPVPTRTSSPEPTPTAS